MCSTLLTVLPVDIRSPRIRANGPASRPDLIAREISRENLRHLLFGSFHERTGSIRGTFNQTWRVWGADNQLNFVARVHFHFVFQNAEPKPLILPKSGD